MVVREEGRCRHSEDYVVLVEGRPVGWKEEQSGRLGARDGGSAGRGRLGAHVVDPSTDNFDS